MTETRTRYELAGFPNEARFPLLGDIGIYTVYGRQLEDQISLWLYSLAGIPTDRADAIVDRNFTTLLEELGPEVVEDLEWENEEIRSWPWPNLGDPSTLEGRTERLCFVISKAAAARDLAYERELTRAWLDSNFVYVPPRMRPKEGAA